MDTQEYQGSRVQPEPEVVKTPVKPSLSEDAVAGSLKRLDDSANQLLNGKIKPITLQNYISFLTELGVPKDRAEVVLLLRGIKVTREPKDQDALEAIPPDPNSDVEILRRALSIEPLPVTKLRENPNLQRTTIDRNTVSVSAQGTF